LPPPIPRLFPYTTLFRSESEGGRRLLLRVLPTRPGRRGGGNPRHDLQLPLHHGAVEPDRETGTGSEGRRTPVRVTPARRLAEARSEEHTSELQSRFDLVC